MHDKQKRAVVLLSGGLDSTTTLAIAKSGHYDVYALSFDYGQRQRAELDAARRAARVHCATEHRIVTVDLQSFGGSALTGDIAVPKNRQEHEIGAGIPPTYVPARNTIFLSHALAWAEVLGAFDIFIGVNAIDYSGYPDCRPDFITAFQTLANLATGAATEGRGAYRIHAPLIHFSKAQIIKTGLALGVDFALTHSCYDPQEGLACGACDACILRRRGFEDAQVTDPTTYYYELRSNKKMLSFDKSAPHLS